jgi:hypothetical protein
MSYSWSLKLKQNINTDIGIPNEIPQSKNRSIIFQIIKRIKGKVFLLVAREKRIFVISLINSSNVLTFLSIRWIIVLIMETARTSSLS